MTAVAVAGSRKLPAGQAPRWLIRFLLDLDRNTEVNLRAGIRRAGRFELDVYRLCQTLRIPTVWWIPEPNAEVFGREATWERDYDMVAHSEVILAFVTTDDLEARDLDSGTVRLVEKAQDRDVPAFLYGVDPDGSIYLAGTHGDLKNLWRERVPHP